MCSLLTESCVMECLFDISCHTCILLAMLSFWALQEWNYLTSKWSIMICFVISKGEKSCDLDISAWTPTKASSCTPSLSLVSYVVADRLPLHLYTYSISPTPSILALSSLITKMLIWLLPQLHEVAITLYCHCHCYVISLLERFTGLGSW